MRIKIATLFLALTLTLSAQAFTKTLTYEMGKFTDVRENDWFASEVASAYELGLMNGTSDTTFSPSGNVKVCEAITLASRAHAMYNNKDIPETENGGKWYDRYVKHLVDNGIITENTFDDFERYITRMEMAVLFHDAMPAGYYNIINDVETIPDVATESVNGGKVLTLYRAGIVMGADKYGTFSPESNLKRSEAAAIINRVALPENRLNKILEKIEHKESYILCQNANYDNRYEGIASGWTLDNRGGPERKSVSESYSTLVDISDEYSTALIRSFNLITSGCITTETSIMVYSNGACLEFRDKDDKPVFELKLFDNSWQIKNENGTYTVVKKNVFNGASKEYFFRIVTDIDSGNAIVFIDGENCGKFALLSDNILNFRFATDEKSKVIFAPGPVLMTVNFAVYENFDLFGAESVYGWETDGNVKTDTKELVLSGKASATRNFEAVNGKTALETYIYLPDGENTSVTLSGSGKSLVKFESCNGKFKANGKEMYSFSKDMWYRLRIEADSVTGRADIILNGRRIGNVITEAGISFDAVMLSSSDGNARFDNLKVFSICEYSDYVPEPSAKSDLSDFVVGINVCSLWTNGTHYGWYVISPYEDNKPVLGYYDEGVPETADWEIKYMVDHGIDFQAFCWYPDKVKGAIKYPEQSTHLHDAYMNAKYSDYMKYVIIWETYNSAHFGSKQFREYVIPYWFENYFLDERYLKLDNRIVLPIYAPMRLIEKDTFGSVQGVKAELDYLEAKAKEYGFGGFIFLANDKSSDTYADMGFDASWAYHWGEEGYQPGVNKNSILDSARITRMHTVPTISVGLNGRPWGYNESLQVPMMSAEDFGEVSEWVKNEYLPTYSNDEQWKQKLVMLSTWNEYGEGTYIMPSGLNGFGYLDALRASFTKNTAVHEDVIPSDVQKARITHRYPQYSTLLRRIGNIKKSGAEDKLSELSVLASYVPESGRVSLGGFVNDTVTFENGAVTATAETADPVVNFRQYDFIDVSNVETIAVTLKGAKGYKASVFFATEESPELTGDKCFSFDANTSELATYYIDAKKNPLFKGKIKTLRVDPIDLVVDFRNEYTVGKIEFLGKVDGAEQAKPQSLIINSNKIESIVPAELLGTKTLFPFDPETAMDFMLNTYTVWDRYAGSLTVNSSDKKVVFTVGKDTFTVDGKSENLGYKLYLADGLPMIDMEKLCLALGYEYDLAKDVFKIKAPINKVEGEEKNALDPGVFEFDRYTTEGWTASKMNLISTGSTLFARSTDFGTDPQLYLRGLRINAEKYWGIEMRCRYNYETGGGTNSFMQLFFTTILDPAQTEDKSVRIPLDSSDTGSEWKTYKIDLTKVPKWKGMIQLLRLDPFNAHGTMEIDYIRFIEDENYVPDKADDAVFSIANGDAESTEDMTFYSTNATITITEDEGPKRENGNHVYKIEAKPGKNWTYFRQNVIFVEGKTYKVEFDGKYTGNSDGTTDGKTAIVCNLQYKDASGKNDHVIGYAKDVTVNSGWHHVVLEHKVTGISSQSGHQFSIYTEPVGDTSACFMIDNVVVTEIG